MLESLCGNSVASVATRSLTGIGALSSMKAALLALTATPGTLTVPTPSSKLSNRPDCNSRAPAPTAPMLAMISATAVRTSADAVVVVVGDDAARSINMPTDRRENANA